MNNFWIALSVIDDENILKNIFSKINRNDLFREPIPLAEYKKCKKFITPLMTKSNYLVYQPQEIVEDYLKDKDQQFVNHFYLNKINSNAFAYLYENEIEKIKDITPEWVEKFLHNLSVAKRTHENLKITYQILKKCFAEGYTIENEQYKKILGNGYLIPFNPQNPHNQFIDHYEDVMMFQKINYFSSLELIKEFIFDLKENHFFDPQHPNYDIGQEFFDKLPPMSFFIIDLMKTGDINENNIHKFFTPLEMMEKMNYFLESTLHHHLENTMPNQDIEKFYELFKEKIANKNHRVSEGDLWAGFTYMSKIVYKCREEDFVDFFEDPPLVNFIFRHFNNEDIQTFASSIPHNPAKPILPLIENLLLQRDVKQKEIQPQISKNYKPL